MSHMSAVAMLLSCLGACSEDECPSMLSVCDVSERGCQQEIMEAVSCLRGGKTALPPVTVVSESELAEALTGSFEADPEQTRRYERWLSGLSLFSLAPSDYSLASSQADWVSQVAAVYLPDSKEIMVVDRGESLSSEEAVMTFAHEVVHALQDADYHLIDFQNRWARSYDSSLAIDALIEGEAVLYQNLISLQLSDVRQDEVDWEGYFDDWRAHELNSAEFDDAPYTMADVRFPYAFGGGFVTQYFLKGGREAVDSLIANPPVTTREIMFGRQQDSEAPAAEFWQRALPDLGDSFELVSGASLGSWITRIFAARMRVPIADRLDAAEDLLTDSFSVQENRDTGQLVAAWRVRLRDPQASFPGSSSTSFESWSEAPDSIMLASEPIVGDARALAWQSYEDSAGDEESSAAASTWSHPRSWKRGARGCDVHAPPLVEAGEATR